MEGAFVSYEFFGRTLFGQPALKLFQAACSIIYIKNTFTKTYHPQMNGQVERDNRSILAALHTYVVDLSRDWNLYAYNCQPHT